ncbi:hypothetical protein DM02DRAFT_725931 [Periconia macrospinosa]|uniref:Zn(2)-C6 fungal-type domain-containing protein n=1 Tax=Periconia macrospinosa TaxID=97972 RepID=A0A2V1E403_9PLEO|nr:hypothetical protein DM02DRAFT_725931 [Periconia macrospinosa]
MPPVSQEKRLRVQGPRSSGGCRMCKQRHVKCDENRPECNKCLKGGRRCEYPRQAGSHYKQHVIIYTVSQSPSPFPDLYAATRRALHHYRLHVAPAITLPFHSELWSTVVFQMSEKYSFVMSALVALSNMYEVYQQPSYARQSLQQNSIRHYNKAIRDIINVEKDESSWNGIVVSCLMFYALDCLRGSWPNALRHAISGMNMIAERRKSHSYQLDGLTEVLHTELAMLPFQALELGNRDDSRIFMPFDGFERPRPKAFSTAEESYYHFQVLFNHIQKMKAKFQQSPESGSCADTVSAVEKQQAHEWIQDRMRDWGDSFAPLQRSMDSIPDIRQRRAVAYLSKCWNIMVGAFTPQNVDYVIFKEQVVDAMASLVAHWSEGEEFANNKFSLYMYILPLFFRDLTQGPAKERERVLSILRSGRLTRREGAWDTQDMMRIAERVITMKEQMPGQTVSVLELDLFDGCRIKYSIEDAGRQSHERSPPQVYEEVIQLESRLADLRLDPSPTWVVQTSATPPVNLSKKST